MTACIEGSTSISHTTSNIRVPLMMRMAEVNIRFRAKRSAVIIWWSTRGEFVSAKQSPRPDGIAPLTLEQRLLPSHFNAAHRSYFLMLDNFVEGNSSSKFRKIKQDKAWSWRWHPSPLCFWRYLRESQVKVREFPNCYRLVWSSISLILDSSRLKGAVRNYPHCHHLPELLLLNQLNSFPTEYGSE